MTYYMTQENWCRKSMCSINLSLWGAESIQNMLTHYYNSLQGLSFGLNIGSDTTIPSPNPILEVWTDLLIAPIYQIWNLHVTWVFMPAFISLPHSTPFLLKASFKVFFSLLSNSLPRAIYLCNFAKQQLFESLLHICKTWAASCLSQKAWRLWDRGGGRGEEGTDNALSFVTLGGTVVAKLRKAGL